MSTGQGGNAPVNFLALINAAQKQAIEAISTRLRFNKKEYIFQASLTHNTIYIVLRGRVKLFRLAASGHECIQWFCFPGEIFGLSENADDDGNGLYAQSLAPTDVYAITKNQFNRLLATSPTLALPVIEQLTQRVRTLGDRLLHIACDDAYARLLNVLQRLGSMYGTRQRSDIVLDIPLTHQDIADMIGVCRQTVSTLIARLKRQGIISTEKRMILIKQPATLAHLAQQHTEAPPTVTALAQRIA